MDGMGPGKGTSSPVPPYLLSTTSMLNEDKPKKTSNVTGKDILTFITPTFIGKGRNLGSSDIVVDYPANETLNPITPLQGSSPSEEDEDLDELEANLMGRGVGPDASEFPNATNTSTPLDYYALLGLHQTDVDENTIRAAYKRAATLFHPDRHLDPQDKETASRHFLLISQAHDVLTDPSRRYIYDRYGAEALEHGGWDVGMRGKSSEEIRLEFLERQWESGAAAAAVAAELGQSHGDTSLMLDGRCILATPYLLMLYGMSSFSSSPSSVPSSPQGSDGNDTTYEESRSLSHHRYRTLRIPPLSILRVAAKQSVSMHLTSRTQMVLDGTLSVAGLKKPRQRAGALLSSASTKPIGTLNLGATLQHTLSHSCVGQATVRTEVGGDQTSSPLTNLECKVTKTWGSEEDEEGEEHMYAIATANVDLETRFHVPPSMSLTLGRRLGPHSHGSITYRTPDYWSLGTWGQSYIANIQEDGEEENLGILDTSACVLRYSLEMEKGQSGLDLDLEVSGSGQPSLSISYQRLFSPASIHIHSTLSIVAYSGFQISLLADKSVSKGTKVGFGVDIHPSATMWKIQVKRWNYRYTVPILLSTTSHPVISLISVLLPLSIGAAAEIWYFNPARTARRAARIQRLRKQHADQLAKLELAALQLQSLMRDQVLKRRDQEAASGGLVITSAYYGPINGSSLDKVDVIIPLQALVNNSQLSIGPTSKVNITGIYDPAFGEDKELMITYTFRGKQHFVKIGDGDLLSIPQRAHLVSGSTAAILPSVRRK